MPYVFWALITNLPKRQVRMSTSELASIYSYISIIIIRCSFAFKDSTVKHGRFTLTVVPEANFSQRSSIIPSFFQIRIQREFKLY